jgi:hypothetical protein
METFLLLQTGVLLIVVLLQGRKLSRVEEARRKHTRIAAR